MPKKTTTSKKKTVASKAKAKKTISTKSVKTSAKKVTSSKATKKTPAAKPTKVASTSKKKLAASKPKQDSQKPVKESTKKTDKKSSPAKPSPIKSEAFILKQKNRLLELRDNFISGSASENLRRSVESGEASAFGMHQADAGSDAYDRDFALSRLSQERNALHEINEALTRIENGSYGVCEMSGKPIPRIRLEAMPFARYTVECQAEIEKDQRVLQMRRPVTSIFGLTESGGSDSDEELDNE